MRKTVTVKLKKPLKSPDGDVFQVVLREPKMREILKYGEPYTVGFSEDGNRFPVENFEATEYYMSVCLVEPNDPAILEQAGVHATRAIKDALFSFFLPEEAEDEASLTSPTT